MTTRYVLLNDASTGAVPSTNKFADVIIGTLPLLNRSHSERTSCGHFIGTKNCLEERSAYFSRAYPSSLVAVTSSTLRSKYWEHLVEDSTRTLTIWLRYIDDFLNGTRSTL